MPVLTSRGDNEEHLPPRISGLPKEKSLRSRIELLRDIFCYRYNTHNEPEFYLRIPGRVNLIGEHIDYCGYSVCPMALEQDILVAVSTTELHTFLQAINRDTVKYGDYVTDSRFYNIDVHNVGWASYLLCGVRGVTELLEKEGRIPVSMQLAVSGNIPPGSGLSSSSALVCAGVLATALSNSLNLSKLELASLSATSEHHIGTVGGGMDQAIIFLGTKGDAKLIEFNPLKANNVSLLSGAVFVIAHSLVTKNKAASSEYNTRVVECRLATKILAKKKSLQWKELFRLADLQKALDVSLEEVAELVERNLHEQPYTKDEICHLLGVTKDELNAYSLTPNTQHIQEFKLQQRALHVFQEALRVEQFHKGCQQGCDLKYLGQLMTESHRSLRDLYECSHPQLDLLVRTAESCGALGARLTGAGWGGCIVGLTTEDKVDSFISRLKETFYKDRIDSVDEDLDNLVFATQPGHGAEIYSPHNDYIIN